ncbi:hypothetical protein BGAL_0544g00050 [Botrytis galanthina]|uniref:Uncharacterized protein n=1 Tax=Botrytis galanthina TaxID=278940 RepID=A0A4S8QW46_9HELO|nr:hypothetical protein BGAL_0544g00050 [Botrytis galanthina]
MPRDKPTAEGKNSSTQDRGKSSEHKSDNKPVIRDENKRRNERKRSDHVKREAPPSKGSHNTAPPSHSTTSTSHTTAQTSSRSEKILDQEEEDDISHVGYLEETLSGSLEWLENNGHKVNPCNPRQVLVGLLKAKARFKIAENEAIAKNYKAVQSEMEKMSKLFKVDNPKSSEFDKIVKLMNEADELAIKDNHPDLGDKCKAAEVVSLTLYGVFVRCGTLGRYQEKRGKKWFKENGLKWDSDIPKSDWKLWDSVS